MSGGAGKATHSYDISDYKDVDTTVGSLTAWRSLLTAAKARNLKVFPYYLY
jgi:glycosidase